MKDLTLAPMSSYQTKIAGLIFTPIALILLLIVRFHGPLTFLTSRPPDRQADLFFVAVVFGMYMIAFSKEKNDDERVRMVRAKSMQTAFMVSMGTMVAITLTTVLGKQQEPIDILTLCIPAAFGLGLYLVMFHIGLYFDPSSYYNDDTVFPNIRKNKKFFVVYFIAGAILLTLAFLTHHRA